MRLYSVYLPPGFALIDFFEGLLVAINLYAVGFVDIPLRSVGRYISIVAGFSFALYLFHLPLLHFGATLIPSEWSVPSRGLALGIFTISMVFCLGYISERKKPFFAQKIDFLLRKMNWH